jgi:hypothetical protein
MLNEYPQEFVDFIMKPLRSNHPYSDTIYQGTVSIPYVKGISKKFRHIGNRFNVRNTFKTVMETELKKTVFWDVAPCRYCVDRHSLLEKSKLAQHAFKEGQRYVGKR